MNIDDIFRQRRKRWDILLKQRTAAQEEQTECPSCHAVVETSKLREKRWVCPHCGFYLSMDPVSRIRFVCDEGSFRELFGNLPQQNPIKFPQYEEKLATMREKTGGNDAFLAGEARIRGIRVAIGVMDSRFLMGSMGTVVGEKIARLTEYAGKRKLPLIIFSASGGARMQEGLFSLMQMAKTAAMVEQFKEKGGLFISYLTNPTTGGVSASYASLGDIIIAEPDALICFAGPRVIEQTIGQKLPKEFQHAEFLLEHGMIDMVVERKRMRSTLHKILKLHASV
ncbi:MAG: acetyl-CoA carboxylase, carboxyltransferase subunit beta [Lachnospiraceae bacterium]|nr:acetyl-CoA carboxylase, carboxyltransferase subunit beta [Lachnospiraceae bacterium]